MSPIRPPLWPDLKPEDLLAALANPPDRYRPVPWLAWTGDLDWPVLSAQLADMRAKGITEFFLFPIYGMELPYMSAVYWERVRQALDFCLENGMKCWIYDDYNWPSGVCAGTLLRDRPDVKEHLLWVTQTPPPAADPLPFGLTSLTQSGGMAWGVAAATEARINVFGCDWLTPMPGYLDMLSFDASRAFLESTHERYLRECGPAAAAIPGFFTDEPGAHVRGPQNWTGLPFTHDLFEAFQERYGYDLRDRLADLVVPPLPQGLSEAETEGEGRGEAAVAVLPPPPEQPYREGEGGRRAQARLSARGEAAVAVAVLPPPPEQPYREGEGGRGGEAAVAVAQTRCHYWRLVAERFGEAYAGTQRKWCDHHGIAYTGHCLGEDSLITHVSMCGDHWEVLKHFTIPGIDMLSNADGFTYPFDTAFYGPIDRRAFHMTCKLVHGIVRHSGAREMLSEAYGVCDWGLTLARQKRGLNYQVALGVTLFNDNSLITSIADFRKYAIAGKHFTQPWWQQYAQYADYNARVAALHAEGEPVADVAILYPRSTIWAASDYDSFHGDWYTPPPGHALEPLQEQLYDLLDELIREQWHADFIFEPVLAEATIGEAGGTGGSPVQADLSPGCARLPAHGTRDAVAAPCLLAPNSSYRAIVVPSARYLPAACLEVLADFAAAGGLVIFAGDLPECDPDSLAPLDVAAIPATHVGPTGPEVAAALAAHLTRPLILDGDLRREFISSRRHIAGHECFYLASMTEQPADLRIHTTGGPVTIWDPNTLESFTPKLDADGSFPWHFEQWQGVVVMVGESPASSLVGGASSPDAPAWLSADLLATLDGPWDFTPEPGNMLRLDLQARPDPANQGCVLGWHNDCGDDGWVTPSEDRLPDPIFPAESPWHWLRAKVTCEPGAQPQRVVADNPDVLELFVNGCAAPQVAGTPLWTEENLHFNVEGLFVEGENWVHIRTRTSKYNDPRIGPMPGVIDRLLQPVVLVGNFTVAESGALQPWRGTVTAACPWEDQGLPSFAGTGVYRRTVALPPGGCHLRLPNCGDAVEVRVDGVPVGQTAWPPYVFQLSDSRTGGTASLEIRVRNTLGNIIRYTYAGQSGQRPARSGLSAAPLLLRAG